MTLTALATETYVTLWPENYTAPVFTYLLKLYCTVRSREKKSEPECEEYTSMNTRTQP